MWDVREIKWNRRGEKALAQIEARLDYMKYNVRFPFVNNQKSVPQLKILQRLARCVQTVFNEKQIEC